MSTRRHLLYAIAMATATTIALSTAGCGGSDDPGPGPSPTPLPSPPVTASAYILPNATTLGEMAFGDKPITIFKGERLRWVNADSAAHVIVADSPDATDFRKTDELRGGGEQSFVMTKLGTTRIHCEQHPNMIGTLIVRER